MELSNLSRISGSPEFIEKEPLRALGYIQSYGVLLTLQEPELTIAQISNNSSSILGIHPDDLINRPLSLLFDREQMEQVQQALTQENTINPLKLSLQAGSFTTQGDREVRFDGILHRSGKKVILELEPLLSKPAFNELDYYRSIHRIATKLRQIDDLQTLFETTVTEIRQLTGFDRVMLYRFSEQGHGKVIAEDKKEHLEAFLGLNYPASDIPLTSRELTLEVGVRVIADIAMPSAEIIPVLPQEEPLDLSNAVLRGVLDCHTQYLKNMRVSASLTIAIAREGELWGLIACHHYTPKYLPYAMRAACKLLGQIISLEMATKKDRTDTDYKYHLNQVLVKLIEWMSVEEKISDGLTNSPNHLLELTGATGVAIWQDDDCICLGKTPEIEAIASLVQILSTKHPQEKIVHTNSLVQLAPNWASHKEIASGLLAISLSETESKYILWFRPETLQTVKWAGRPQEASQPGKDGEIVLCPRQSFALWKELVHLASLPWKTCEIEAALELREAIVRISLRKADRLAKLYIALQASEARTREKATQLETTLHELQNIHKQLLDTQTQLIQNEKMSSLGQLVAGVAHEINNPVNFIYGNLTHTEQSIQDLIGMLNLYTKYYPEPIPEIQSEAEAIELDFTLQDLPKMLASMQVGAHRIQEIVQSLRNFSRLDESDRKTVDLHEGIDSTLLILGNHLQLKPNGFGIQVIKNYGDFPKIDCYPGQLNQVFMNILANAIDVLEERDRDRSPEEIKAKPSQISISTEIASSDRISEPHLIVRIADNGTGITPENLEKLFNPFFTTKPIGKGTGMGLAISYQIIVEKHSGVLTCQSELGQGAEFTIEIPLIK
ncbi:ATP-binding protein [Spirulina sp. 06S082]|uniref:ATP-binding protein n=1 Tax=Spirulina sp. 06S082 TaxID=3110248 RepID=UPI002B220A7B|nr:ATP-binding protein [Spirulina sp. 06S082]MEA5472309.1 ATP-binding protein [Spirulina sp. 06S082]